MYTVTHSLLRAKAGEPVRLSVTVTDKSGTAVDLTGASAVYKIARHAGDTALLTITDANGITLSGNIATVDVNTADLKNSSVQLLGDFFGQLQITQNGDSLFVAEGPLCLDPVIA